MKILYIHNEYARTSGEEHASRELVELLREHGHEVRWFTRSSAEISNGTAGKVKALLTGIYNPSSAKALDRVLTEYHPDIVQVQNLYPLISTSIFGVLRRHRVPVVMRCPNYRLFCPSGLSLDPSGEVCERCWGRHEVNCVRLNCMGSRLKSLGYAARNAFATRTRHILNGVDIFIVQSEFQKQKFISQGISDERISIVAGISPVLEKVASDTLGEWVSFVGRVSAEKGIYEFIEAARNNPEIPFKVAGNLDENFHKPDDLPKNLEFVGFKNGADLDDFYINSRIIGVPSKWYEGFPNVIVRGMLHHKPVVTTAIGAMQSIIDHKNNGLLVIPGNSQALGEAIATLWHDEERCRAYGASGYQKASREYSREQIYESLIETYQKATDCHKWRNTPLQ